MSKEDINLACLHKELFHFFHVLWGEVCSQKVRNYLRNIKLKVTS